MHVDVVLYDEEREILAPFRGCLQGQLRSTLVKIIGANVKENRMSFIGRCVSHPI